jgi:hypothetical protein
MTDAMGDGAAYVMIPADDGGQSFEMRCTVCGESGNILASRFVHAQDCPINDEQK